MNLVDSKKAKRRMLRKMSQATSDSNSKKLIQQHRNKNRVTQEQERKKQKQAEKEEKEKEKEEKETNESQWGIMWRNQWWIWRDMDNVPKQRKGIDIPGEFLHELAKQRVTNDWYPTYRIW